MLRHIRLPDPLQTPDSRPSPNLQRTMTEWATMHGPRHIRDGLRGEWPLEDVTAIDLHNIYSVLEPGEPHHVGASGGLGAMLENAVQRNKRRVWYAAYRVTLRADATDRDAPDSDASTHVYPAGSRKD